MRKNQSTWFVAFALLAILVFLGGCDSAGGGGGTASVDITWESDGSGFIQYKTNLSERHNKYAAAYFSSYELQTGDTFAADLKKLSGNADMGFGIVWEYTSINEHYGLIIDTKGNWKAYVMSGGSMTELGAGSGLQTGYGTINNVSVTKNGNYDFTISFNNGSSISIDDTANTNHSTGNVGFCLFIGSESQENFPDDPVDVRFDITTYPTDVSS